MPVTISIWFLSGRAHLHHWQAHHSDGKTDWPPAPWRLLRALVAVAGRGLTTLPYPDDAPEGRSIPVVPISGMASLKKRDVPKSAQGKLAFSKAKQTLTLKEPLTDEEAEAFRTANPSADFGTAIDELRRLASQPQTTTMSDVAGNELPLSRLSAALAVLSPTPDIWLPNTSGGHTRQFFPIHEGGVIKNSGSAVFDTFAVVQKDQPVLFHWPDLDLQPGDQRLNDLQLVLSRMTYFGRAESWCRADVQIAIPEQIDCVQPGKTQWACLCIEDGGHPSGEEYRDYILERKLVALPLNPSAEENLATEARRLFPRTEKINPNRTDTELSTALLDESPERLLLRCLLRESGDDMRDRLDRPIGSRWVHYAVPRAVYDLPHTKPRRPSPRPEFVEIVRYVLNTASVNRPVLPPVTDTLLIADKFRNAILALHHAPSHNLSGHLANGTPNFGHQHAFYWPTDEDNDGFIDHVTVNCQGGFAASEIDALRRLSRIRQRDGRPDLLITPVYVGTTERYSPWAPQDGSRDRRCRMFVSATPYFCPVHLSHGRGRSGRVRPITPEILKGLRLHGIITSESEVQAIREVVFDYAPHELARALAGVAAGELSEPIPPRQFFPVIDPPAEYPLLPETALLPDKRFVGASLKNPDSGFPFGQSIGLLVNEGTRFIRAMSFCRRRRRHEAKGYGRMLCIEFLQAREPRPFAIGDQCHFGLGLFVPQEG